MDKKLQTAILQYIQKCKEVTKSQVVNEVSKFYGWERIDVQEAIHILLDDERKVRIIGLADTLGLTKKGHEGLTPWYKQIYYFLKNNLLIMLNLILNLMKRKNAF